MEFPNNPMEGRTRFKSTPSNGSGPMADTDPISGECAPDQDAPSGDVLIRIGDRKRSTVDPNLDSMGQLGAQVNWEKLVDVLAKLMFVGGPLLSGSLVIIGVLVLTGLLILSAKALATILITTAAVLLAMSIFLAIRYLASPPNITFDMEADLHEESQSERNLSVTLCDDAADSSSPNDPVTKSCDPDVEEIEDCTTTQFKIHVFQTESV